ncbi:hypothetical protein SEA_BILLNYE_6 [Streptomyces phage BillNye]|uniref:Uncharacterized protein n=1 Tax=Streptomyces phage BillNye TaxID=2079426 RepID=A0A2L1IVJ8_9CAUD|nr:hypothetical protein FDJ30_gp006 [Streptomyces phage BillNye]AVD99211.1 hypothetical protein SEA_BILLNYE_6 [Streptomyces phage BillNye]
MSDEQSTTNPQPSSAFDPENFGPVVIIQLMRLYDVQMALLACHDPEKAGILAEMHEKGMSFTPPPAYSEELDEPSEESSE